MYIVRYYKERDNELYLHYLISDETQFLYNINNYKHITEYQKHSDFIMEWKQYYLCRRLLLGELKGLLDGANGGSSLGLPLGVDDDSFDGIDEGSSLGLPQG